MHQHNVLNKYIFGFLWAWLYMLIIFDSVTMNADDAAGIFCGLSTISNFSFIKGTIMHIEKVLIKYHLRVSKVS